MRTISFRYCDSPESNDHQVRVLVDDVDLLLNSEKSYLGLDPPEFFGQTSLDEGGTVLIGRCGCGVVGCDNTTIVAKIGTGTVNWVSDQGVVYEFERTHFLHVVSEARNNHDWESTQRTAERFVEELDFVTLENDGYSLEWASARIKPCQIHIAFNKGGDQRIFQVGWNGTDPFDAKSQVERWILEYA